MFLAQWGQAPLRPTVPNSLSGCLHSCIKTTIGLIGHKVITLLARSQLQEYIIFRWLSLNGAGFLIAHTG